ncbi:uncharacterized protein LOC127857543 [Dreissena polymorpha]|uniref:uncharacterized protein LOC127857543 n=1 Tax=Dreissena polymorpha TaxID=45954 RepID=UPI002263E81B|nr:uncharacterized protein LOC127857543 [Dreissena polymorpha]
MSDIKTLHNPKWINNKIINAFLHHLAMVHNATSCHWVLALPSYLMTMWMAGNMDTWRFRKIKFQNYKWVFLPVNINDNHWVLMVADLETRALSILDSLGWKNRLLPGFWLKFAKRIDQDIPDDLPIEWLTGSLVSARQQRLGRFCYAV